MKRYTASTEQIAQVTVRLHTVKCIVNVFKRIPGTFENSYFKRIAKYLRKPSTILLIFAFYKLK
jgi:hypothetical protein